MLKTKLLGITLGSREEAVELGKRERERERESRTDRSVEK